MKDLSSFTLILILIAFAMLFTGLTAQAQEKIPIYAVSINLDHGDENNVFLPTSGTITRSSTSVRVQVPEYNMDGKFEVELVDSVKEFPDGDNYDEYMSTDGIYTIVFILCPANLEEYVIVVNNTSMKGVLFKIGEYLSDGTDHQIGPFVNL